MKSAKSALTQEIRRLRSDLADAEKALEALVRIEQRGLPTRVDTGPDDDDDSESVMAAVISIVKRMPEEFHSLQVRIALETEYADLAERIERSSVARALARLAEKNQLIEQIEVGRGRIPAKYRRIA